MKIWKTNQQTRKFHGLQKSEELEYIQTFTINLNLYLNDMIRDVCTLWTTVAPLVLYDDKIDKKNIIVMSKQKQTKKMAITQSIVCFHLKVKQFPDLFISNMGEKNKKKREKTKPNGNVAHKIHWHWTFPSLVNKFDFVMCMNGIVYQRLIDNTFQFIENFLNDQFYQC